MNQLIFPLLVVYIEHVLARGMYDQHFLMKLKQIRKKLIIIKLRNTTGFCYAQRSMIMRLDKNFKELIEN